MISLDITNSHSVSNPYTTSSVKMDMPEKSRKKTFNPLKNRVFKKRSISKSYLEERSATDAVLDTGTFVPTFGISNEQSTANSLLIPSDDHNKLSKDKGGLNPSVAGLNDTERKKKGKFKSVFGFIKNVGNNGHAGEAST